jgi:hypothetical protein
MVFVWPALAIALGGLFGGIVLAFVRGRRTWRGFKALSGALGERLDEVAAASGEIETHLTNANDASERLSTALGHLRRSRARLDVQLAAVREAREAVEREVPFLGGR